MDKMNKEQFDKITKYDSVFACACKSDYARITRSEFDEIAEVYSQIFNKVVTPQEKNCMFCKLRIIKELGFLYFKFKNKF